MAWDLHGFCLNPECRLHLDGGCQCPGADEERRRCRGNSGQGDGAGQDWQDTAAPGPDPRVPAPAGGRSLSKVNEEFWSWPDRYGLMAIFAWARARRVSPWALLGEVLVRMLVRVPPAVQLPALVGGNASLNLFVGIVGRSGQGKGAAASAAADVIDLGGQVVGKGIGSGEGLVKLFGQADKDGTVTRTSYAELLSVYEIDSFGAQQKRTGATIGAELRKTFSGEPLGFAYADNTKRVLIEAHSYRLCVSAGIQPGRGSVLLDDADAGTPQRFVWLPATDPDAPDTRPKQPDPLHWEIPPEFSGISMSRYEIPYVMEVCKTARDVIDASRLARLRGEGNALDGHALLTRLKVATALSIFDGRAYVSDDDWSLSGLVMEVSDQTRESIAAQLREAFEEKNTAQARAEARRANIVTEAADDADRSRAARNIINTLIKSGGWVTHSDLRRSLNIRLRGYFEEAVNMLRETGQIESKDTDNGHGVSGVTSRLAR